MHTTIITFYFRITKMDITFILKKIKMTPNFFNGIVS